MPLVDILQVDLRRFVDDMRSVIVVCNSFSSRIDKCWKAQTTLTGTSLYGYHLVVSQSDQSEAFGCSMVTNEP